tara:strand:- start:225 stop:542 length:318 start_codon:yes stop_codon:yes gene_type:complete
MNLIKKNEVKHKKTETKSVGNQTHAPNKMILSTSRAIASKVIWPFLMKVGKEKSTSGNLSTGIAKRAKWLVNDQNRMLPVTGLENEAWMWEATCASHFETKKRGA